MGVKPIESRPSVNSLDAIGQLQGRATGMQAGCLLTFVSRSAPAASSKGKRVDYYEAVRAVEAAFTAGFWSGAVVGAGALYVGAVAWRWWNER